jgi:lysophospholipase L1-like esterase
MSPLNRPGMQSIVLIPLLLFLAAIQSWAQNKGNPFEREILAFEASDRTNQAPAGAILFIGSSSIRLWKSLAKDLPDYRVINRGFGGSQIEDSIRYADRIIFPYSPSTIVLYAGGNDINSGKSGETVFADFQRFVSTVHTKLPKTKIAYISVAPNPARWHQIERIRRANELIEGYAKTDSRLSFINAYEHMLGPDGLPKPDIFVADRLHMNTNGYAIWTRVVGEHLKTLRSAAPNTGQ